MYWEDPEVKKQRIDAYVEEIVSRYHLGTPVDLSGIAANKHKIISGGQGSTVVRKKLNEQIHADFIKESDLIEESADDVVAAIIDERTRFEESNEKIEPKDQMFGSMAVAVLQATSPLLHDHAMKFQAKHLEALHTMLEKSRTSQLHKHKKGKFDELTHDLICELNGGVLGKDCWSTYRSEYSGGQTFVRGASWVPVSASKVSDSMDALLEWYNNRSQDLDPITRAAILHCEFIRIHPFADGNGRTARLLVGYELTRNNLPTAIIKARDRKAYLEGLEKGITTGDVSDIANVIAHRVKRSQQRQLDAIKKYKQTKKSDQKDPQ